MVPGAFRQLLEKVLPRSTYRAVLNFYLVRLGGFGAKSFSQEGEDMVLSRIFERKTAGFFVDVGAHHPVRFSNTFFFYRRGWKGINIEPNPEAEGIFRRYRKRDVNLSMGVGKKVGDIDYHMFDEPALNTFDSELSRELVEIKGQKLLGVRKVSVMPLSRILENHASEREIDFLNVDTEGRDLEVLSSNDWDRFRPSIVLVEIRKKRLADYQDTDIYKLMSVNGYELFAKTYQTAFFRDGRSVYDSNRAREEATDGKGGFR